jgi:hypothetical protein
MATTSASETTSLIVKLNNRNDGNGASASTTPSHGITPTGSSWGKPSDKTATNSDTNYKKQRSAYGSIKYSLQKSASNLSEVLLSMKRIGNLGSWAIAANSLTGPAMLCLPDTYQRAGLIPTTVVIMFVCILSALCCLHMSNTISKVPGNRNFTKDVRVFGFGVLLQFYSPCSDFDSSYGCDSHVYNCILSDWLQRMLQLFLGLQKLPLDTTFFLFLCHMSQCVIPR